MLATIKSLINLGRYSHPAGFLYLYWPCLWGTAAFAPTFGSFLAWTPIYLLGSVAMRTSGCIVNDIWDRNIDSKVARTKDRALASGQLSIRAALLFMVPHLAVGLWVLSHMEPLSIAISFAVVPLAVVYPKAKYRFRYPQFILGLCFNWGVLVGASVMSPHGWISAIPLYLSGVLWTQVYDTIYAMQDREEDRALGLRSTALEFEGREMKIFGSIIVAMGLLSVAQGAILGYDIGVYTSLMAMAHGWLWLQCLQKDHAVTFRRMHWFGLMMTVCLLVGRQIEFKV